ncbi:hypothetical protein DYB34_004908 [Aphanomyces astaci]|uniref:Fibronectin type-III domain-containing protein n=1 Tax=Aphanomyces astaci TaxID=112090 RepID=A0A3R7D925_APHAT|nr:hypothetical protein DYB34_004908 [Aphanomyces astaci]
MRAEINPRDGYIHGTVLADAPFVDSPLLDLEIEDRHHFVVRMAYDGACAQAGLHLERRGAPVTPKTNPKAPFVNPIVVRFPITSDGSQHVYYAPLFPYVQGDISRIRFFPSPTVTKVRGCIDRYSQVPLLQPLLAPSANISMITTLTNGIYPVFSTLFHAMTLPFASTYNCYPGDEITVQGRNFGDAALVHINGAPCQNNYPTLESIPELALDAPDEEVLTCVLPANLPRGPAVVTVTNERYRGLVFNGTMVAYAGTTPCGAATSYIRVLVPVQLTTAPSLSNVMAHAVDITWTPPPNDVWSCLTITGYLVIVRRLRDNFTVTTMLGNVTTTTLATLSAGAPYSVTVSAVVESQVQPISCLLSCHDESSIQNTTDWQQVDMYGQRLALPSAIAGLPSPALVFSTLALVPSGRARGGDGFAFVIQNEGGASIGRGGNEVGYGGIRNAVSVEFDTTYNADTADMYENHVSIHTRGRSQPNSAHHAYSLGATSEPFAPHFQASAYVSQFFAKATGASAWGSAGVGCLQVTVDDRTGLSVPLHLDNTLDLTGGRAFVGFTAATGAAAWQAHDILSWQWESLRMFPLPPAPFTHV